MYIHIYICVSVYTYIYIYVSIILGIKISIAIKSNVPEMSKYKNKLTVKRRYVRVLLKISTDRERYKHYDAGHTGTEADTAPLFTVVSQLPEVR